MLLKQTSKIHTLAMTGASGAVYGLRLLEELTQSGQTVYFLVSAAGKVVINIETDLNLPANSDSQRIQAILTDYCRAQPQQIRVFDLEEWTAPVASGSAAAQAMIICPCSSGTLSAIACGSSRNLLERAADVMIKEQRKLILVPRETPLSVIHLENMLKLARMGVVILPASPGFYHRPQNIAEVADFIVARVLDHLGIEHTLSSRWGKN